MDIAAMSMNLSMGEVMQEVSIAMLKKTMDTAEANALSLVSEMMPPSRPLPPTEGNFIDVMV